ncbi:MAG: GNAT family N-acetyltransferase [Polyangiaceae bacterium]|nr:GNAT family N-acetyltransferase [Polyangiaceae bacterium]
MNGLTVRRLTSDDALQLASLLGAVAAPGPRVDRGSDPFAHPRATGDPLHVGAFCGDRLVAVVGAVAQQRHVGGVARRTVYLCDVRVASDFRGTFVLLPVLKVLREALSADSWSCAVVLEGNPMAKGLSSARWFGACRLLGRTRHVAWPAFLDVPPRAHRVEETDADTAAAAYFRLAPAHDLSPADEPRFRTGGRFFVERSGTRVVAVGKWVDERPARRIVADDRSFPAVAVLNLVARARRFPALPRPGASIALAYLSWFASERRAPPAGFARAVASLTRAATHVCFGVDAALAPPAHPLAHHFVSCTYGYGDVPSSLRMQSHELTWM